MIRMPGPGRAGNTCAICHLEQEEVRDQRRSRQRDGREAERSNTEMGLRDRIRHHNQIAKIR